jgi:lipoate-protein ligase A
VDIQEVATVKRFEYKVPGGKLLRAKLEIENGRIMALQLSGDFFMEPETDLEELETKLTGFKAEPAAHVEATVVSFFTSHKTRMTGAGPKDFAYVINQAIKS